MEALERVRGYGYHALIRMKDFEAAQRQFEKDREKTSARLSALIDKRLAILRKIVPGASYTDDMGSNHLFDEGSGSVKEDPVYIAMEYATGLSRPRTEEYYGGPLPEFEKVAQVLFDRHADVIREILEIGEYLSDEVRGAYG